VPRSSIITAGLRNFRGTGVHEAGWVLLGWLAFVPLALGQVTVTLALEQNQVLPGEAVRVAVRVTNFSGQSLLLGKDEHWLQFSVETSEGRLVPRHGTPPVRGEFELPTAKMATKRLDLAPHFDLGQPGRYMITATVRIEDWGQDIVSKTMPLQVVNGTVLWEQKFGVPQESGGSGAPAVRRYVLQQAMHLKQMKLYARVVDGQDGRVYGVLPLGPVLSFSNPEKIIDPESNLHVLWQTGARSFNHSVVSPDGKLVGRQTHEYSDTRPMLRRTADGRVVVSGGIRRVSPDDLPTPRPPASDAGPEPGQVP
jgi:hypothetical protein